MKGTGTAVIQAVSLLIILLSRASNSVSTLVPVVQCGEGRSNSVYFEGYCYEVIFNTRTWYNADRYCKSINSTLASIHDNREVKFLKKLISDDRAVKGNRVWIGLNALHNGSIHSWSDDSPVDFTNWDANEPNNHNKQEECVNMYIGHGKWNDESCNSTMGFVCKRNKDADVSVNITTTLDPTTTEATIGKCSQGWIPSSDRCYLPGGYDEKDHVKWEDAKETCHRVGGYLVSIRNEIDQAFLTHHIQFSEGDVWIGLHSNIKANEYNWVDDSQSQYTNWASRQPPRFYQKQGHCVKLLYNGKWQVAECSKKLAFICYTDMGNETDEIPEYETSFGVAETYGTTKIENLSDDSQHRQIMTVLALILATVLLVLLILVGLAIVSYCPHFDRSYFRNPFKHQGIRQQNTLFNVDSSMIEYQEGFANDDR